MWDFSIFSKIKGVWMKFVLVPTTMSETWQVSPLMWWISLMAFDTNPSRTFLVLVVQSCQLYFKTLELQSDKQVNYAHLEKKLLQAKSFIMLQLVMWYIASKISKVTVYMTWKSEDIIINTVYYWNNLKYMYVKFISTWFVWNTDIWGICT